MIVLAGFPALPWGQTAPGPKPATLDALRPLVSEPVLNALVDKVCRLTSTSPPMLLERATAPGVPPVVVESAGSGGAGQPSKGQPSKSVSASADAAKSVKAAVPFSVDAIATTNVAPVLGAFANAGVGALRPAVNCAVASLIM